MFEGIILLLSLDGNDVDFWKSLDVPLPSWFNLCKPCDAILRYGEKQRYRKVVCSSHLAHFVCEVVCLIF